MSLVVNCLYCGNNIADWFPLFSDDPFQCIYCHKWLKVKTCEIQVTMCELEKSEEELLDDTE